MKPRQPFRAPARAETVPIPAGSKLKPGRCEQRPSSTRPLPHPGRGFFVGRRPDAGRSAEMQRMSGRVTSSRRATYVSSASARSRSSYDHSALDDPAELRRKIQAGPPSIWRYSDFLPFDAPPADRRSTPGFTPLIRSERLAERLGVGEVYVKNDAANPTHSFKDRVVNVAVAKARELGYEVVACASTGQPRERRRRPRRRRGARFLRLRARRPGGAEDPRHRRLRHQAGRGATATTTTSTGSARSCRPSIRGRS